MIRLFLILIAFIFVHTASAQNFFYLSAGNSTIVACNSNTTSVVYNMNSSASGLYSITIQPPTGGSQTLATSATSIGHVFLASAGVYTMTGYDGASNVLGIIHYSVTLATVFNPTITSSADSICAGTSVSLSFSHTTSGYTISPFNWSTGSTVTPISVSPAITTTYTLGGLFTSATKTCNVVSTKSIVVNPCTGISEFENSLSFKIYPNPVSSVLHISTEQNMPPVSQLEITNLLGEIVTKKEFENTVDLNALQNGCYFLMIATPSGSRYRYKFIKE
jgi:hypothetical protein